MVTMLYGVIQRLDSLREFEISLKTEARKLSHVGLCKPPSVSALNEELEQVKFFSSSTRS